MTGSNFIDHIRIFCRSGKGGAGAVHFRREKYLPKGGPDGGDGGRGGHIILKGNRNLWTLLHLRYMKHISAGDGENGKGGLKTGSCGRDMILEVPLGTIVKDIENETSLMEITDHDEMKIMIPGGRGGLGNNHFKSPTNQTPRYAQPGEPAKEGWYTFELKILADVGLVGFPNAGKSTLLSVLSAAKPKIDNYPFTTLTPNIGIVSYRNNQSFIMADIPGIIEGASEGKGLGLRFLRHIERNSVLLFMVPADSKNITEEYHILLHELEKYNKELLDKKKVMAITKADLLDDELTNEIIPDLPEVTFVFISSVTGYHLNELKDLLWEKLNEL